MQRTLLIHLLVFSIFAPASVAGQVVPGDPFAPPVPARPPTPSGPDEPMARGAPASVRSPQMEIRGRARRGHQELLLIEGQNNQFQIRSEPPSDPLSTSTPPEAKRSLVAVMLNQASLQGSLRLIARLAGFNLVVDPDVQGSVTLGVSEVSAVETLKIVLESQGLKMANQTGLVRIMTSQTAHRRQQALAQAEKEKRQSAPRRTLVRHLNYADAKTVSGQIQTQRAFLSEQGTLVVDERTNTLFVIDLADSVERLETLLKEIDVPELQVEIEARVVKVTTGFAREIGAALGFELGQPGSRNRAGGRFDNPSSATSVLASFLSGRLIDTLRLDSLLSAGERAGKARMLSKPRISAQNNAEAVITQGSRIPVPVNSNFSARVRFETAALRLTVNPRITNEATILLKLKLENNIPDFTQTVRGIPTILTSEADTMVLVPDGGTAVIGGILVETDRRTESRVPGLARMPILGGAFRGTSSQRETREILFFLTSRIQPLPGK